MSSTGFEFAVHAAFPTNVRLKRLKSYIQMRKCTIKDIYLKLTGRKFKIPISLRCFHRTRKHTLRHHKIILRLFVTAVRFFVKSNWPHIGFPAAWVLMYNFQINKSVLEISFAAVWNLSKLNSRLNIVYCQFT